MHVKANGSRQPRQNFQVCLLSIHSMLCLSVPALCSLVSYSLIQPETRSLFPCFVTCCPGLKGMSQTWPAVDNTHTQLQSPTHSNTYKCNIQKQAHSFYWLIFRLFKSSKHKILRQRDAKLLKLKPQHSFTMQNKKQCSYAGQNEIYSLVKKHIGSKSCGNCLRLSSIINAYNLCIGTHIFVWFYLKSRPF